MALNLWECDHRDADGKRCKSTAVGVGGAIGLLAVGWQFIRGKAIEPAGESLEATINAVMISLHTPECQPRLYCPAHRTDALLPCCDKYRTNDDPPGPNPCPHCKAELEAEALQEIISNLDAVILSAPEKT